MNFNLEDKCVNELFDEQVKSNPNKKAILYGDKYITYKELDEQSNQIAQLLLEIHIEKEDKIAILMHRGPETIISMLGIMKAGGCYVPIFQDTPYLRIQTILNMARVKVLFVTRDYIDSINIIKVCRNNPYLKNCILIDTNESDKLILKKEIELVEVNQRMWNQVVKESTNIVNAAGWVHEDTGFDFHDLEILEYKRNVKAKLMPYLNQGKNVLEIGCGSGLLMYDLAKYTKHYTGIDFANEVITKNTDYIIKHHISNITVRQLNAHEVKQLGENVYDVIIINSVVQYFPCIEYLEKVLSSIEYILKETGVVFIGDIRDKEKQEEYYTSVRNPDKVVIGKIDQYLAERIATENELFVEKSYFKQLKEDSYYINKVEISEKIGDVENELTKYRYDVMLHVNKICRSQKLKKQRPQFYLDKRDIIRQPIHLNNSRTHGTDLMYVMFTSGTTGEPKGVMIEHRSVVNMLESFYVICEFLENEHVLCLTNFCFDISVLEIFLTLCKGLTIVLADTNDYNSPIRILNLIKNNQVTVMQATPSRFKQIVTIPNASDYMKSVKTLLIGGESLDEFCVNYVNKNMNCNLYNVYGPTETTVWSTYQKVEDTYVTIGKAIDNTEIYILNDENKIDQGNKAGEILIAGKGLARGYINNPVLTEEKFVDKFFADGKRVYRTGDVGRFDDKGNLIFLGRVDRQVKINGNRIEIDEIEVVIKHHSEVKDAIVIDMKNKMGRRVLVAYYIATKNLKKTQLRKYLSEFLPSYMIPSYLIELDELPLNASGKIDRKKLPFPIDEESIEEYVDPDDMIEKNLLDIWKQILGKEDIALNHNFFELGGDSFDVMQMLTMIHLKYDVEIFPSDVIANCTIEYLAKQIYNRMKYVE